MASAATAYARDQAAYDHDQTRLVQAWRHEFLHVSMMAAFVTMACTAAAGQPEPRGLQSVEANLPDEPAIDRAIRHGLLAISSRYNPAFFAAQEAYLQCNHAVRLFKEILVIATLDLEAQPSLAAYVRLADAWRATSRSCLVALEVFDHNGLLRQIPAPGTSLDSQCPLRLMQLLRAASAGETLASSGLEGRRGQLPAWVQRRRWGRQNIGLKCTIEIKGDCFDASIRNVSLGGALLDGMPPQPRGTRLVIAAQEGWMFHASVIWCRGESTGVKFDEQLPYNHPLIDPLVR